MASSKKAIYAAIVGNGAIAVTKFIAASLSGSSAMLAEGIHSLVDTGNGGLLLLGIKRSQREPNERHPFGYGKEVYFYALLVAVLIFAVGGGISIYEGILHTLHPTEMGDPTLSYIVLSLAIVFESGAWWVAFREFRKLNPDRPLWASIQRSKDPTTFTVLFEDTAAVLGLVVAFVGIWLGHALDMPVLDGVASILIGVILCGVASLLVYESKALLLGESVLPEVRESLHGIAAEDPDVDAVVRALTLHMGPHDIVLALDLQFRTGLTAEGVERAVDRVERAVREEHPDVRYIFVEAESLKAERRAGKASQAEAASEGEAAGDGSADA